MSRIESKVSAPILCTLLSLGVATGCSPDAKPIGQEGTPGASTPTQSQVEATETPTGTQGATPSAAVTPTAGSQSTPSMGQDTPTAAASTPTADLGTEAASPTLEPTPWASPSATLSPEPTFEPTASASESPTQPEDATAEMTPTDGSPDGPTASEGGAITPTELVTPSSTASATQSPTDMATATQSPTEMATPTATEEPTEPAPLVCADFDPAEVGVQDMAARFESEIWPLLIKEEGGCVSCHTDDSGRDMILLSQPGTSYDLLRGDGYLSQDVDSIHDRVTRPAAGRMPMGAPPWSAEEQHVVTCFSADQVAYDIYAGDNNGDKCEEIDPGTKGIHRLNKVEYNNTVRDILGDSTRPADSFPSDDRSLGFDNIAGVLSISPLHVEKYETSAGVLVGNALGNRPDALIASYEAEDIGSDVGGASGTGWNLWSNGTITVPITLDDGGTYRLAVRAHGDQAGDEPAKMRIAIDGQELAVIDVTAIEGAPEVYDIWTDLEAGTYDYSVSFINDYYQPLGPIGDRDRNLIVDWMLTEGPFNATPGDSNFRVNIMTCSAESLGVEPCAREILSAFGLSAWRRPLTEDELSRLVTLVQLPIAQGDDFEEGIRVAMQAILLSPNFIYRTELDADPTSAEAHALSDFELASRLSYFLWSSAPDAQLLALADGGQLSNPEILSGEVSRMLEDPKSEALAENFAGQWLYARAVDDINPDPEQFGEIGHELREAMAEETKLLFNYLLQEDRNFMELLGADYSFMNDELAEHYGLPLPGSDEMVRVDLPGDARQGFLTHATFLAVTSNPDRTSPVKRGKWVLEQLLCEPPPPPPPDVEGFEAAESGEGSMRDRMESHYSNPECASCHQLMDPIGFGLDELGPVGWWRDLDDFGYEIDATGELPDGRTFDGPFELSDVLRADPAVPECIAEQLFVYGLGRGTTLNDDCVLERLSDEFVSQDHQMKELIHGLVLSEPFTTRRGETE